MAANHETVLKLAQMIFSKRGWRLFSNPMGQGFVGKVVEEYESSGGHVVTLTHARRLPFGVCNPGGSDGIGWRPVRITKDMIPEGGLLMAQFVAVECKTPGYSKASKDQKNFLAQVVRAGGLALMATKEGDAGVNFDELRGE